MTFIAYIFFLCCGVFWSEPVLATKFIVYVFKKELSFLASFSRFITFFTRSARAMDSSTICFQTRLSICFIVSMPSFSASFKIALTSFASATVEGEPFSLAIPTTFVLLLAAPDPPIVIPPHYFVVFRFYTGCVEIHVRQRLAIPQNLCRIQPPDSFLAAHRK